MIETLLHLLLRILGFDSRRAPVPGGEVHYFSKAGKPGFPTLVLVHGIASSAAHFAEVLGPLSRMGYPILAPDLPGHGRSSELAHPMDAESLYQGFRASLDAIAPAKFVLMGNSLGGALSLRYASEHPERIESLVLASPGVGFESEKDWLEIQSLLQVKSAGECAGFLRRIYHRPPFYLPLFLGPFFRAITRPGIAGMVRVTRFSDLQPPAGLTVFQGRTLLIWGKSERLFRRRNLELIREALPPHAVVDEPDAVGHCPHFDDPRWFVRRMDEFARAHRKD